MIRSELLERKSTSTWRLARRGERRLAGIPLVEFRRDGKEGENKNREQGSHFRSKEIFQRTTDGNQVLRAL